MVELNMIFLSFYIFQILYNKALITFMIFKIFFLSIYSRFQHLNAEASPV